MYFFVYIYKMNTNPSVGPSPVPTPTTQSSLDFSNKNTIIIVLLVLLILSFLGINLLLSSGQAVKWLADTFGPSVLKVVAMLGYSTGELINDTADVAADISKTGIDVAEGTAQSIGNLLKNASKGGMSESDRRDLERALTSPKCPQNSQQNVSPASTTDSTQKPISSKKQNWCLVGEFGGKRGCAPVSSSDRCMSGQIFPSQELCLRG